MSTTFPLIISLLCEGGCPRNHLIVLTGIRDPALPHYYINDYKIVMFQIHSFIVIFHSSLKKYFPSQPKFLDFSTKDSLLIQNLLLFSGRLMHTCPKWGSGSCLFTGDISPTACEHVFTFCCQ